MVVVVDGDAEAIGTTTQISKHLIHGFTTHDNRVRAIFELQAVYSFDPTQLEDADPDAVWYAQLDHTPDEEPNMFIRVEGHTHYGHHLNANPVVTIDSLGTAIATEWIHAWRHLRTRMENEQ